MFHDSLQVTKAIDEAVVYLIFRSFVVEMVPVLHFSGSSTYAASQIFIKRAVNRAGWWRLMRDHGQTSSTVTVQLLLIIKGFLYTLWSPSGVCLKGTTTM